MDQTNKFKKPDKKQIRVISVALEKKHHDFIKSKNINFSAMIRDFIESLMGKPKK